MKGHGLGIVESATLDMASEQGSRPLNPKEFVLRAIKTLRDPSKSRGIHSVYSGFNEAFREYFPTLDPVEVTSELADAGDIEIRYRKGGVMLYLPGEAPGGSKGQVQDILRKMGLDERT